MRAIVFDFDGVILDTETGWYESVRRIFDDHGEELTPSQWGETAVGAAHDPDWVGMLEARLGRPLERASLAGQRHTYYRELALAMDPLPGVVELLAAAVAERIRLAIASNSPRGWVVGHLERLDLLDYFAHIWTVDRVATGKPDPELYLSACESLTVSVGQAVAIEDSPTGVAAAKAAGLACVAVPLGLTVGLDLSAADRVVTSLAEVDLVELASIVRGVAP